MDKLNSIPSILALCFSLNSYCQDTLTVREVFDFEIGDVFHYWEHGEDYDSRFFDKKLDRITITDKNYSADLDTLIYKRTIEGYIYYLASTPPGSELPFEYKYQFHSSSDEVRYADLDSPILHYLNKHHFGYLKDYDWGNFDTLYDVSDTLIYQSVNLCNTTINGYHFIVFNSDDLVEYGKGLGLTRILQRAEECICTIMDYEMIFLKKGMVSCGVPDNRTNTGLNLNLLPETINIYPNPAQEYIYLKIPAESVPAYIQINNLKGQEILYVYLGHYDERIDIKNLEPGAYLIRFISGKRTIINKLLKI